MNKVKVLMDAANKKVVEARKALMEAQAFCRENCRTEEFCQCDDWQVMAEGELREARSRRRELRAIFES